MKINSLILMLLALPSTSMFAAQQTNCDELAQRIQKRVINPYVFVAPSNNLMFRQHIIKRSFDDTVNLKCTWTHDDGYFAGLPISLQKLQNYQGALMRCIKTSTVPSPLASKTIEELQQKKELISKCLTLRQKSIQDVCRRSAEIAAQDKKQKEKENALDAFIDADDKE